MAMPKTISHSEKEASDKAKQARKEYAKMRKR